ncbi:transcription initiation factor IIF subunit alpha [Phalaenopsis equestris]|uniref:transcription initiation factor IIF subunit alpha n=1 Tax=Phalaenopsis equestris TaxID=78828 RepID=UPI0009E61C20|nr:transcription initiation factor IIF subunit alpha [Phalaenopsis equestris]
MSFDLVLKQACEGCGSPTDLYGSNCRHKTLCPSCGKTMAENRTRCNICGVPITRLIREYNVRASTSTDKAYFIGRFCTGLPPFSKKKNFENKWTINKDGLQGRQLTDSLREKFKNKPWVLEDETGQYQYHGQLEGSQLATYYLLVMQGKEFVAIPAGSWYNFNKVAQYKQLTLEEAEEMMNKRKHNATGYERWMMKAAINGAAAFGEINKSEGFAAGGNGADGIRHKKPKAEENGDHSDRGEEDENEEESRKLRLGLNRKGGDDDEDGGKVDDMDDDDIEKGDDWEHEEIFTDDDEAVGNDPEEREDLAPEIPAPPEIKQDEDDEIEGEEGGLSKSGKELKKLLGKAAGLNESDAEEEEDDDDMDDETTISPVLAPKQKDAPKDEPADNSPAKQASGSARGTPSSSKSSKSKKKTGNDDGKSVTSTPAKKETKPLSIKEESPSTFQAGAPSRGSSSTAARTAPVPSGPVTEEEIRAVLLAMAPVTTQDLVANFKGRIKLKEDKAAFADILKRISKIQKTNGQNYVVLR